MAIIIFYEGRDFVTIHMQLLPLLARKKLLFLEVEEVTSDMCVLSIEDLVIHTDKRGRLLEEISKIDEEIKLLCDNDTALWDALNHICGRQDLPDELAELFDLSLSIKAVINRILKNEDNIRLHLISEKQRVVEKMENLNMSGTSVAERYHRSVQTGRNQPFGGGNNKII